MYPMKLCQMFCGAVFTASIAMAGAASASVVSVNALSGPWDPSIPGNLVYDNGVHLPRTILAVNPGDNITITYLSGLTNAFSDLPPTADALG
jgi:hypothetical protein